MTLLRLNPLALSRSRFALSPLAETIATTILLRHAHTRPRHPTPAQLPAPVHLPAGGLLPTPSYLPAGQRLFGGRDPFLRGLVDLLAHTKWLPDVVALPPGGGMGTTLASELEPIRAMTDAEIRAGCEVAAQYSWIDQD
ncbi:hypothetical protein, partial [Kribbella sp.]|uniref:hypothetical protein n=1 Tax=Kribbella sp. TaxID=1871183 RepID=UPI002D6A5849